MQKYLKLTDRLARELEQVEFMKVPRSLNLQADKVARRASSEVGARPLRMKLEIHKLPSIKEFHTFSIQGNMSWTTPVTSYLKHKQLPSHLNETKKIKKRATRFTLLNGVLYKRGFSLPYLKCVK